MPTSRSGFFRRLNGPPVRVQPAYARAHAQREKCRDRDSLSVLCALSPFGFSWLVYQGLLWHTIKNLVRLCALVHHLPPGMVGQAAPERRWRTTRAPRAPENRLVRHENPRKTSHETRNGAQGAQNGETVSLSLRTAPCSRMRRV